MMVNADIYNNKRDISLIARRLYENLINNLLKAPGLRHTFGPGVFSYSCKVFAKVIILLL